MNRISKTKRNQLLLTGVVIAAVIAGLWFTLIKAQQDKVTAIGREREAAEKKLAMVTRALGDADKLEAAVGEASARLGKLETGMASGDLYSWAINTLRRFKQPYAKIEIPQFSQIDGPKPTSMLASFPYQQASLAIGGTAQFHDFGRFIADFENAFPYVRVQNLQLEPLPAASAGDQDKEKLSFRMDIIALVKPGA
jgi:hypothetical protein